MADLTGVNAELADRVRWVQAEAERRGRKGYAFNVTTGYRPLAEQQRLWNNWQAALTKTGGNVSKAQQIAPLAARPGTSMHGRSPALAVDLACAAVDNALRAQLGKEAGLYFPVPGEPWHMELAAGRKPLPVLSQPVVSPKQSVKLQPGSYTFLRTLSIEVNVNVQTVEVGVSLDDKGNGWWPLDGTRLINGKTIVIPWGQLLGATPIGQAPERDGGYEAWPNQWVSVNNTNDHVLLTVEGGAPNGVARVYVSYITT